MRTVIIIPTLNEHEAIPELLRRLEVIISNSPGEIEVLFVDAMSTDGTTEFISTHAKQSPWLHLLQEPDRQGLGMGYARGMIYAMNKLKPDFILEFDGDLQHRPEDIPKLLSAADSGFDYIIGSRFIPQGSIPKDWGWDRIVLSKGGNLIARAALSCFQIRDVTSGFKLSRVKGFLDCFDFSRLYSVRHSYKIHLFYYMLRKGAQITEVPIIFEPRAGGESKLIKNDIIDTLRILALLRLKGP